MGVAWAGVLALLAGSNAWLACSALEPLRDRADPVFVFAAPPWWHLPVWWGAAFVLVAAVFRRFERESRAAGASRTAPRGVRPAAAVLLALPLAAVLSLVSPWRDLASPWVYLFVDLQAWLLGSAAALVVVDLDSAAGHPMGTAFRAWGARVRLPGTREAWLEAGLVSVLLAASLATSPIFRFQSAVNGDEPKYVRYLENWYRGRGMDVEGLAPIGELDPGHGPELLRNLPHVWDAAALVVIDLWHDTRRFVGADAPARPGPARGAGGWFVAGKRGGVYQVHNPGFSLLLLPGYVIDRAFLNWTSDFHPQLPSDLYCTATIVLGLYLAWGVALFRLLLAFTKRAGLSWLVSALAMLSLPTAAFAYQYYPEVAAGLAIALLARFVLLPAAANGRAAAAHGLVAGVLPWLHVRFGLVALCFVAVVLATRRRPRSVAVLFTAAFLLPVGALAAYYYYLTGSIMPWALHALCTDEAAPFSLARAIRDLPNFWFDGNGGLPAHAPVYLLAVPGLWLAWRRARLAIGGVAVIVLALAVPAAGHGWVGGGTSPLRLVAAVVPLLALPLAEAIARFGRSRWFVAALGIASVIGLQNAWTYSTHLIKSEPWLIGPVTGGWLSSLLFPGGSGASLWHDPTFWIWSAVTAGLLVWPRVAGRSPAADGAPPGLRPPLTTIVTVLLVTVAVAASGLGWWSGHGRRTRFMPDEDTVRHRLLTRDLTWSSGSYWLSTETRVDLATLFPNAESVPVSLDVGPTTVRVGQSVVASLGAPAGARRRPWGRVTVDFADGTPAVSRRFVGRVGVEHRFGRPGEYVVRLEAGLPGRAPIEHRITVRVEAVPAAPVLPQEAVSALPPEVLARPPLVVIDEVRVGERHLELRCRVRRRIDTPRFWAWVVLPGPSGYATEFHLGEARPVADDAAAVWVRIPHPWSADEPELVGVLVGVARPGKAGMVGRSDVATFFWPGRRLTVGAEVIEPFGVSPP